MNSANSSEKIDHNRQCFLGPATMAVISAHLGNLQLRKRRNHTT